ncbi:hypothetical protein [Actinoallomurus bryophytorum]|uniref:hypothetical protein n=1 Tax=Actinoallomurus bryophytorum TaxID=1490222 RepID=UPI00115092B3|nr:hypothetical protein [Actinoallomurus bryophytorum]
MSALETAGSGSANGSALVGEALGGLIALRQRAAHGDVPAPEELDHFRRRVAELLKAGRNPGRFSQYREHVLEYAERGRFDGYELASLGRSALEFLREDFADLDVFDDMTESDLAEIDEELTAAAEEAPPILDVPSWVPESHWWWRAPKQTDMSEEERRHRLYGGELDDY